MNTFRFEVMDTPRPQGSKRFVGVSKAGRGIMIESSATGVGTWREAVKTAVLKRQAELGLTGRLFDKDVPLQLTITFLHARPKNHYRTGRNAHLLRDDAPHYVTKKPDLSKLIRSTEDAISAAGLWYDDCQIVQLMSRQLFTSGDEIEGAWIVIRKLEEES